MNNTSTVDPNKILASFDECIEDIGHIFDDLLLKEEQDEDADRH